MPVGFYGKLPSHGDFLQRGVSDDFVNRWDAWLQEGIACSRSELGDAWLDVFLTSPLWRFALASGVVGGPAWAGVLLPSVDRVGRYFPLTIVAELPPGVLPFELAVAGNGWFDWAEALSRRTLDDELVDLNRLEAELRESDTLLAGLRHPGGSIEFTALAAPETSVRWLALAPDGDMGRFFARFAAAVGAAQFEPLGVWWSMGSERIPPSVLMTRGLPPAGAFRDLLGGAIQSTQASMAETIVGLTPVPMTAAVTTPLPPPMPMHWISAAATDAGRVRDENQDTFVERTTDGLWLVADGMGGHQGGGLASELIAERVSRVPALGDVRAFARDVAAAVHAANEELRRRGDSQPAFDGGSTVVALCVRGGDGIVMWAGDSRLYRLREGGLTRLTRDHSVAEETGSAASDAHMLTRAVGGADLLDLEELQLEVRPADRYLLCSDGLYGDLTSEEIASLLASEDCMSAARGLIALALQRGGVDNATAIVIAVASSEIGD